MKIDMKVAYVNLFPVGIFLGRFRAFLDDSCNGYDAIFVLNVVLIPISMIKLSIT